jgi:hypothetical protein
MASYIITELAGFQTEPLPIKGRTKVYERLQQTLKLREAKIGPNSEIK